jgi:hypothetical protein
VVAGSLGFSGGTVLNPDVGWLYYAYAETSSKKLVGSVKGLGSRTRKS